jgi:cilia- and flagella-associated protein 251
MIPKLEQGRVAKSKLPLQAEWTMGFDKDRSGSVHLLEHESGHDRLFYATSHVGVIVDLKSGRQFHLIGHVNRISCSVTSVDDRYIITADTGPSETAMIVWDSYTGRPIRAFDNPHPHGVQHMAISSDGRTIATLSHVGYETRQQTLALWNWTNPEAMEPQVQVALGPAVGIQRFVAFNRSSPFEIITNGDNTVVFASWESGELQLTVPSNASTDFNTRPSTYTVSEFLGDTGDAITATSDGHIIQWSVPVGSDEETEAEAQQGAGLRRGAVKYMKVSDSAVYCLTLARDLIACGGEDGMVRFYDFSFRLVAWFEELDIGPVSSISFARSVELEYVPDGNAWTAIRQFNFVVASRRGLIASCNPRSFEDMDIIAPGVDGLAQATSPPQCEIIVDGFPGAPVCLDAHPYEDFLVIGTEAGSVQVWSYGEAETAAARRQEAEEGDEEVEIRLGMATDSPIISVHRSFEGTAITSIAYDPTGSFICVGTSSGTVRFLQGRTLTDIAKGVFKHSKGAVQHVAFSTDSMFLATASEDMCVALYARKIDSKTKNTLNQWIFVGKYRSHTERIVDIAFFSTLEPVDADHFIGDADGMPQDTLEDPQYRSKEGLISVGEDRQIIEYDLESSTPTSGLHILSRTSHGQSALPSSVAVFPSDIADFRRRNTLPEKAEDPDDHHDLQTAIMVFDDAFKIKQVSSVSKRTTATHNSPATIHSPFLQVVQLRTADRSYAVFRTTNRLGVLGLPFDGTADRATVIVGHPQEISSISASHDGKFVFTAGGNDLTVIVWRVHRNLLAEAVPPTQYPDPNEAAPRKSIVVNEVEGGEEGEVIRELKRFFYYGQIDHEGERSSDPHAARRKVPIVQIPKILRAVGLYASEAEFEDIMFEAKHANFAHTGELSSTVTFAELVRLFVNHRPPESESAADVHGHFRTLAVATSSSGSEDSKLAWVHFKDLMQEYGEPLSPEEFDNALESLIGDGKDRIPQFITTEQLSSSVLGFEE